MSEIKLVTERLIVREYRQSDLEKHHALISDPSIMYYIQDVFTSSREESEENLRNAMEDIENPSRTKVYLVMETKEGEYVGGIGYTVCAACPAGKRVEIGYFSYPKFWGRGYTTEALEALVRYAFYEDSVYRMDGTCITENVASRRVMEKCGFLLEGERENFEWQHDCLKSRYLFGLLKERWEKKQNGCEESN